MGTERYLPEDLSPGVDGRQYTSGGGGWRKGGVDCELLVAGSYLHAHRVVLARRSPVLRDMIAQVRNVGNARTGEGREGKVHSSTRLLCQYLPLTLECLKGGERERE